MKILPEDTKFSKWIRNRDNWTCQRCNKKYQEGSQGLQCSHFWSRRIWSTRFCPINCDAMCYGCHSMIENDKQGWYMQFKKKQLGSKYKELEKLSNKTKKKREALLEFKEWYELQRSKRQ